MIADRLLSRLDHVRQIGPDRWIARCPAHNDSHPSLSIRETSDQIVLVKCWSGGCSAHEIVSAVGLVLSDLFPLRTETITGHKPERRPFPAADILRAFSADFMFMMLCACDLSKGDVLEPADKDRLVLIATRLRQALNYSGIAP